MNGDFPIIEPFISQESVRAVLESLLYHNNEAESSLEHLTLVQEFLITNQIPHTENRRLYAVRSILVLLITEQITSHRHNLGLSPPISTETLQHAHQAIQLDSQQQNAELMGWSLLYYRYVRVDLNLAPADLSVISHVDERTLRRYQAKTVERLRDLLTDREAQVRLQQKRLYLLSALPQGKPSGIIGRTSLAEQIISMLRASPPAHLLLTGPSGIGKTSFIHLLLYQQIEAAELDRIVWISGADNAAYVQHHLQQTLDISALDLTTYLASHRVAIILDDIDELLGDLEALTQLITLKLGDTTLYMIHALHVSLTPDFKHIVLPELSINDISTIVAASRASWSDAENLDNFVRYVWNIAGGNPMAAKLAANNLNNINLRQAVDLGTLKNHLLTSVYTKLTHDTKRILYITALCPPFDLSTIAAIWPLSPLSPDSIVELVSCGWLQEAGRSGFTISSWAYEYVQALYAEQPEVRNQISRLIDELTHCLIEDATRCYQIAEHILLRSWPELSITRRLTWVELASDTGMNQGNYAIWASILKGQGDETFSLELTLKYAICLRKLGEWAESEAVLRKIIEFSGQQGEFVWQGRGNLELSIILHQQGLYEQAFAAVKRALNVFERFENEVLYNQAELELAQITFDTGQLADAQIILQRYVPDNARVLALMGEIHLATGNTHEARFCVTSAIALTQIGSATMGRLLAHMGRIDFAEADWASCESHLLRAITLLETHSDQFALARAKTNLAAALLNMHRDYDDARSLLLDAQQIQLTLRDRHGLIFTQRNLAELDRYKVAGEL